MAAAGRPANDLDAQLQRFQGLADPADPEQAQLLEQIREHTRRLQQARGDWNLPSCARDWNDCKPPDKARPPIEDASYRRVQKTKGGGWDATLLFRQTREAANFRATARGAGVRPF